MFRVLGSLTIDAGREPSELRRPMVRRLLLRLLVSPREHITTDRLIEDLWGEDQPASPRAALQTTVARLRKALREAGMDGDQTVMFRQSGYSLDVDRDAVDAWRFERLVGEAAMTHDPYRRRNLCDDALSLWRGNPFSEAAYLEFAQPAIRRLLESRSLALHTRAEADLEVGDAATALPQLEEMLAEEPLRERTWGLLILALYRSGRHADAIAAAQRARSVLSDHGLELPSELARLEDAVFARDPGLDVPLPEPTSPPPGNVPQPVSRLIDRKEELERTLTLLNEHRLVTLVGPGGSGKSRLATEAAHRVAHRFADGTWRVRLDTAGPHEGLFQAVSDDLSFVSSDDADIRSLVRALRTVDALIIFDGCEPFLVELAEFVGLLLAGCPGVRVLATTRRRLGLGAETLVDIGPLPVIASAEGEVGGPAIELFLERARAVRVGIATDPVSLGSISSIVAQVDGLPLGIELAAAQVRSHTITEIEESLARRDDLHAIDPTAVAQHTSLGSLVEYSYRELAPGTQRVLAALSVYTDAFDLDAAMAVASATGIGPADAHTHVVELIEWSLLSMIVNPGGGRPWYRMLSTVRDFAGQRLRELGLEDAVRSHHAVHFCEIVERAEYLGVTGDLRASRRSVALVRRNIGEALRWGLASDRSLALRLIAAMGRASLGDLIRPQHWEHLIEWPAPSESRTQLEAMAIHSVANAGMTWEPLGPVNTGPSHPLSSRTEGRRRWAPSDIPAIDLARHSRAAAVALGDHVLEAASVSTIGNELIVRGSHQEAMDVLLDLPQRPEQGTDPRATYEYLRRLDVISIAALSLGDDAAAEDWIDTLLSEATTARQDLFVVEALHRRACLLSAQGNAAGARATYERLLRDVIEPRGFPSGAIRAQLGWLELVDEDVAAAEASFDAVLGVHPVSRAIPATGRALAGRAHCEMLAGRHDAAHETIAAALEVARGLEDWIAVDYFTAYEGRLLLAAGVEHAALERFSAGFSYSAPARTPLAVAYSAEGLALVGARRDMAADAAMLLGMADRLRAAARAPRIDWLEAPGLATSLEATLGNEESLRLRSEGGRLSTVDSADLAASVRTAVERGDAAT